MNRNISPINQVGAAVLVGALISFVVAYIAFQAELFRLGSQSLGVTFFGFCYFFGSFVTSVVLWRLAKGSCSAKYLWLFLIVVVAVGSIGLGNLTPDHSSLTDAQRNAEGMARLVARLFFWGIPGLVLIFYGVAVIEAQPKNPSSGPHTPN